MTMYRQKWIVIGLILALAGGSGVAQAAIRHATTWASVETPSPGATRAIGGYAHGCLAGGVALPLDGPGYAVVHTSRNRYWGHPQLLSFITQLGEAVHRQGLGLMLVGDMAQPRGGPLSYGHASHQIGLDVDIWYRLDLPPVEAAEREDIALPSVLRPGTAHIDPARFSSTQADLLRLAASDPRVDRIFVNPAIKLALCASERGDRSWLQRLRPWWHHDDHFHVRLVCPADSLACEPQEPVPAGEGCDATLASWLEPAPPTPAPAPHHAAPSPVLPLACRSILGAP